MGSRGKYLIVGLIAAVAAHLLAINAVPYVLMNVALERLSAGGGYNLWRTAERVTPLSRAIVRPSPDFAYAACPYDVSEGPVVISVAPWRAYWSLSLYGANSDNFFVVDDREARLGADIIVVRAGRAHPEGAAMVVESPSDRGVALIRRLAPNANDYAVAAETGREDVCARAATLAAQD
ncbi:MAG: DUF1254 domain-containing protein [Hyphomonadaceae bacterium]